MNQIIARRGMCMAAVIEVMCSCGEKKIPLCHTLKEDGVLHRIGVPCYNVDEHHAIPPKTTGKD